MLLLSATDNIFQMGEEPAEPKMYIVASRLGSTADAHSMQTAVNEDRVIG